MNNANDKNANDNFGELLAGSPFDDSIRETHRREVRERAMRAFDEAAAAPTLTVAGRDESPRRSTPRRALRAALAMAVAASLGWAIFAWRQPAGLRVAPGDAARQLADAQLKKQKAADERLVAALGLLIAFDEEQAALTFAEGVDVCVRERDGWLAGEGS